MSAGEAPPGHWLANLNIEKDIHHKLPDFNLLGYFCKCACCCDNEMWACKFDPRLSLCSERCGCTAFDCRSCCEASILHITDCYCLSANCAVCECVSSTKKHIPKCKSMLDVKGATDDSFGSDSAGVMPPFETLCFKTSCCCCSQGIICDKSCLGYVCRNECCCCARAGAYGLLKPEPLCCSCQNMCMILDCAKGSPCTPCQCKTRGKTLFCCDVGNVCGSCDAGCGNIAVFKTVGHCLCCDERWAIPCDKKEVPCIIALCGIVCYPKCHLDCCKSAADKRILYNMASQDDVKANVPSPPPQAMKRDFA